MNFYGVGVKWGGFGATPRDVLSEYLEQNFWCNGWDTGIKPDFDKMVGEINIGDIVVAKAFFFGSPRRIYIRAIGIVTDTMKPSDVDSEFENKLGFSVCWIKHFEKNICLKANETFMPQGFLKGNKRMNTIYHETSKNMISKIKEMMKYDYMGETDEHIPDEDYPGNEMESISIQDYIDIAKDFILDEAYDIYDSEKITEYPDDMISVEDEDTFGRKIIMILFEVNEIQKKGLILLVPERHCGNNQMHLANMGLEILDAKADISGTVEKLKESRDWDKPLDANK